jgi:long-chain acyl-CoA synthetase
MRLTMCLQQSATCHPNRAATVYGNRTRTYAQVIDRVARLARGLATLGAKPGERIAVLALNSDDYYEAYYAILWAGCLAVPCNTRWALAEHRAALEDCEPCLLLVDQHFVPVLHELPGELRDRTVFIGDARGRFNAEDMIERLQPAADSGLNTLLLVPTMIGILDQYLRENPQTLTKICRLTYGASPISESLMKRALQMFHR